MRTGRASTVGTPDRRTHRRRARAPLALLAALAAAGLALAGTASSAAAAAPAGTGPSGGPPGQYLALGDSVAFGYRPPSITPPEAYQDADSFVSYADYAAAATGLRLVNASCPGETTAAMISKTAPDNGCRLLYRAHFPLHVSYPGTQLGFATGFLRTHPHTKLVSIDIGANDVFLCQATAGCAVPDAVRQAGVNLARILQRLRTVYAGRIVTVTYYRTPQYPASLIAPLNAVLAAATRQYGGVVVDGLAVFRGAAQGGGVCRTGLLLALPGGGCDRHPSAAGHLVLGAAVALAYLKPA